ncbi:hypothetical protein HDU98_004954 [Podochytrium sp. JEL0797]|nr:hypothetical protein HDU98_004954 [Podochytrium sp. JEL0797]
MSQRTATGHNMPRYTLHSNFHHAPTPSYVSVPKNATISFSFTVPDSSKMVSTTGSSRFIFAFSDTLPANPSNPSSPFTQHMYSSSFSLDVSRPSSQTVAADEEYSYRTARLLVAHGLFMFIGWGILVPTGIFVARYLKKILGRYWYAAHAGIMFGLGGCIIIALICVELTVAKGEDRFFTSTHGIIGTLLALVFYPTQLALGFVCKKLFTARRTRIPMLDKAHWWMGRLVALLAVINMDLGLDAFGAEISVRVLYWVGIVGIVGALVVFGEFWLGGAVRHVVLGGLRNSSRRLPEDHVELQHVPRHQGVDGASKI